MVGSLQRSPSWNKRGPTSTEWEGYRKGKGEQGEGREGERGRERREGSRGDPRVYH